MDVIGGIALFITTVVFGLAFAALVRRVLGVPVSLVRAAIAAFLAAALARPLLDGLLTEPGAETGLTGLWLYLALLVVFGVVLAMLLLVIAEMLVPDGSLPGPVELWRGWRARVARTRRYAQIVGIVASHGLSRFLRGRHPAGASTASERRDLARSLRRALEAGGVTFIKLGQQLSTRRDLLPPEFIEELSHLQDGAPPIEWREVMTALTDQWHAPPSTIMASIDEQPLGSASIAQVHAARLPDGTEVVVKVQRPGIAELVERDLDILNRLAATLSSRAEWAERLGLRDLAAGFSTALREELDFRTEAANNARVAADLADTPGVAVAATFPQLSTDRVLVMERMRGVPLGSAEAVLAALGSQRRAELADALLALVMAQVLRTGVFHVDLHPGNVLVGDDGTLAILDFGSVGRLGEATRESLARLFYAIGTGSSQTAADALLDVVDRPDEVDERALEQGIGDIILRFGAGGPGAGAAAFTALFRLVADHGLGIPPAVAAVFRTIATLEGTLLVLDPGYDLAARVSALGRDDAMTSLTPTRVRDAVEKELLTLLPVLRRLPRRMDRLTDAAEHGRLSFGVRLLADPRDRKLVTALWHQGIQTVLAATAGLMSVVLLAVGPGPLVTRGIGIFWVLGAALMSVATILALRVLMAVLKKNA